MTIKTRFPAVASILFIVLGVLQGCAQQHPAPASTVPVAAAMPAPPPPVIQHPDYAWRPELSPVGPVRLEIFPDRSRLLVYRNNILIGACIVSTGKEGHDTPPGTYSILQKEINHFSNEYGAFVDPVTGKLVKGDAESKDPAPPGTVFKGAAMPYFQRLTNDGIGLHVGVLPGYNASHGCIRLPQYFAEQLFSVTQTGVPVAVIKGDVVMIRRI